MSFSHLFASSNCLTCSVVEMSYFNGIVFKSLRTGQLLCRKDVMEKIDQATDVAPLHNPANKQGILAATDSFKNAVQVAVFDTAFHQTMPPEAYTYALPKDLCKKYGIRKYGFHGTSYKYLSKRTANALGKPLDSMNAILCHLGAGASMCAIQGGKSVDTSMGLTPLQGLVMGTRCGASLLKPTMANDSFAIDQVTAAMLLAFFKRWHVLLLQET